MAVIITTSVMEAILYCIPSKAIMDVCANPYLLCSFVEGYAAGYRHVDTKNEKLR